MKEVKKQSIGNVYVTFDTSYHQCIVCHRDDIDDEKEEEKVVYDGVDDDDVAMMILAMVFTWVFIAQEAQLRFRSALRQGKWGATPSELDMVLYDIKTFDQQVYLCCY